jgi:hypothetical protein
VCRLWLLAAVEFASKHRSFNALRARSKPPPFPALGSPDLAFLSGSKHIMTPFIRDNRQGAD